MAANDDGEVAARDDAGDRGWRRTAIYGGFVLGAEYQQATVVALLLGVLVWRQIEMRRHRQVVQ